MFPVLGVEVFRLGTAWSLDPVLPNPQAVLTTVDLTLTVTSPRSHLRSLRDCRRSCSGSVPKRGFWLFPRFPGSSGSGPGRIRTCDTRPRKPLLYPLSYRPAQSREPPGRCYRNVCGASTAGGAIEIAHPTVKLRRTLYVRGDLGHPRQPRGTRSCPWRRARGSRDYLLPW